MSRQTAKTNVARTAHLTAWARSLGRLTAGEVANGDYLAGGVPLDFERGDRYKALGTGGYGADPRALFLREGVDYSMPGGAVRVVLSVVASHSGPNSSFLFDYVTRAFVDGDHSGYGACRLAD